MVRIRLRRTGKTKQPSYRLVIADSRAPRDGKFIEIIGHYNPVRQPKELVVKEDRARYWLSVGAQPSDTVVRLLKQVNVLDANGKVTEAPAEEATASAEPTAVASETPATTDKDVEAVVSEQPTAS